MELAAAVAEQVVLSHLPASRGRDQRAQARRMAHPAQQPPPAGAAGGGPGGANVGQGQPGGARRCALLRAGLPVVSRGDGKCASEFEPAGSAAGPRPSAPSGREDPVCLGTDRRSSLTRSSLTSRRTWTH